jgi:hypothetical protein
MVEAGGGIDAPYPSSVVVPLEINMCRSKSISASVTGLRVQVSMMAARETALLCFI